MEEIFPLRRFGVLRFSDSDDVTLAPVNGSQPFDAILSTSLDLPYRRIEITHASQDREEYLRMRFLEKHGHVPMLGPISVTRDRQGNDVIEATQEAESQSVIRERMLETILDRVQKKARKRYEPDVALLVAFSPLMKPTSEDRDAYAAFAQANLRQFCGRFPEIFLVSTHGEYLKSVGELCSAA